MNSFSDRLSVYKKLVGNTPTLRIGYQPPYIWAKLESYNPSGSIKDRTAVSMVESQITKITDSSVLCDASSGSLGVAISGIAAFLGIRSSIIMPKSASPFKIAKAKAYGANIEFIEQGIEPEHPRSYKSILGRLMSNPDLIFLDQMTSAANVQAHATSTAREILPIIAANEIESVFAGIGTGGTISGIASAIKKENPNCKIIGVDSKGSVYRDHFLGEENTKPERGLLKIEGIGDIVVSDIFDKQLLDDVIEVDHLVAKNYWRDLRRRGLSVGPSSGLVYAAAVESYPKLSKLLIFPDSMDPYLL